MMHRMLIVAGLICTTCILHADAAAKRIMPLGDNITASTAGQASYRYWLWKSLGEIGFNVEFVGSQEENTGGPPVPADFDTDHEGHAGFTADQLLAEVTTFATDHQPDMVLLHIGSNDIFSGQTIASTLTGIEEIIDALRAVNPSIIILVAQVIPTGNPQHTSTMDALSTAIPTVRRKTTAQSPVIIVNQHFGFFAAIDTDDGVNPNPQGEQKMAAKWLNAMTPFLESNSLGFRANRVDAGVAGGQVGGGGARSSAGRIDYNRVSDDFGFVRGGRGNLAGNQNADKSDAHDAVVVGGRYNKAMAIYAAIGGGFGIEQNSNYAAGPGGRDHRVNSSTFVGMGGGRDLVADGSNYSAFGGGQDNQATGSTGATLSAGRFHELDMADYGTISGGRQNMLPAGSAADTRTIGGGWSNSGDAAQVWIGGGRNNSATGTRAAVPGGLDNSAGGSHAFAAGRDSSAGHTESFSWSGSNAGASTGGAGQFAVAAGNVFFGSAPAVFDGGALISTSSGARLTAGGAWTDASSRDLKQGLQPADAAANLDRLMQLELSHWNYRGEAGDVLRLGPMAGDFHALFPYGVNDRSISGVDRDGVLLSTIQALRDRESALDERLNAQAQALGTQREQFERQQLLLKQLEERLQRLSEEQP